MTNLQSDLQEGGYGRDQEDQRQIATDFFQQGGHSGLCNIVVER